MLKIYRPDKAHTFAGKVLVVDTKGGTMYESILNLNLEDEDKNVFTVGELIEQYKNQLEDLQHENDMLSDHISEIENYCKTSLKEMRNKINELIESINDKTII